MTRLQILKKAYSFYKNDISNSVHDIPSYQNSDTYIKWHRNNILHRLNGPAVIHSMRHFDVEKQWWESGKFLKSEYHKK